MSKVSIATFQVHTASTKERHFDANGDGELQIEEVNVLVMSLFRDLSLSPPSTDEVQMWMTTFDANKNGSFSLKDRRK
eukprot:6463271-Amphidinium_carterae.1